MGKGFSSTHFVHWINGVESLPALGDLSLDDISRDRVKAFVAGLLDVKNKVLLVRRQFTRRRKGKSKARKRRSVDVSTVLLAELQELKKTPRGGVPCPREE